MRIVLVLLVAAAICGSAMGSLLTDKYEKEWVPDGFTDTRLTAESYSAGFQNLPQMGDNPITSTPERVAVIDISTCTGLDVNGAVKDLEVDPCPTCDQNANTFVDGTAVEILKSSGISTVAQDPSDGDADIYTTAQLQTAELLTNTGILGVNAPESAPKFEARYGGTSILGSDSNWNDGGDWDAVDKTMKIELVNAFSKATMAPEGQPAPLNTIDAELNWALGTMQMGGQYSLEADTFIGGGASSIDAHFTGLEDNNLEAKYSWGGSLDVDID